MDITTTDILMKGSIDKLFLSLTTLFQAYIIVRQPKSPFIIYGAPHVSLGVTLLQVKTLLKIMMHGKSRRILHLSLLPLPLPMLFQLSPSLTIMSPLLILLFSLRLILVLTQVTLIDSFGDDNGANAHRLSQCVLYFYFVSSINFYPT